MNDENRYWLDFVYPAVSKARNCILVPPGSICGVNAEWRTMWTLCFQVSWSLCWACGPDPIVETAGTSFWLQQLWSESTDPTWLQARGRSSSKRAGGLRPSRNMPANRSSPGPSLALAVGRCDNSCEVRRERCPGPGIHPEWKIVSHYFNLYDLFLKQAT